MGDRTEFQLSEWRREGAARGGGLDEVVSIRRRANRSRLALALAVLLTLAHLAWVPSSLFPVFPDSMRPAI